MTSVSIFNKHTAGKNRVTREQEQVEPCELQFPQKKSFYLCAILDHASVWIHCFRRTNYYVCRRLENKHGFFLNPARTRFLLYLTGKFGANFYEGFSGFNGVSGPMSSKTQECGEDGNISPHFFQNNPGRGELIRVGSF